MSEVVTIGEAMGRLSATRIGPLRHSPELRMGIAGAESNVAVGLTRLGTSAGWIGRVGDDEFGRLIRATLLGEGVATDAITDPGGPTGLLVKERRTVDATRVMYYRDRSAGSRLNAADVEQRAEEIAGARLLHLTGITPALSEDARAAALRAADIANEAGTMVSFDVNYRATLWSRPEAAGVLAELAERATIVFAGLSEARLLLSGDTRSGGMGAGGPGRSGAGPSGGPGGTGRSGARPSGAQEGSGGAAEESVGAGPAPGAARSDAGSATGPAADRIGPVGAIAAGTDSASDAAGDPSFPASDGPATEEAVALARELAARGAKHAVVKLGADGAVAVIDGAVHVAPVLRVHEVDPVGAGDAFTAGYLSEVLAGSAPDRILDTAARCGAFAVTVDGDWEGLPSRGDLPLLDSADVHR